MAETVILHGYQMFVRVLHVVSVHICFQIVKEYTFLDYIMGGCQINFTVSTKKIMNLWGNMLGHTEDLMSSGNIC